MTSRPAPAQAAGTAPALRDGVARSLAGGAMWPAVQAARQLLETDPGVRTQRFLRRSLEEAGWEKLGFTPFRVALLSSFSSEFVHDALVAHGFANGLKIEIYQAGFGTFRQEMLDATSGVYAFAPRAVILAVERAAWLPDAHGAEARSATDVEALVRRFREEVEPLLATFRERSSAALLMHNFPSPAWPGGGMTDAGAPAGESPLVAALNGAVAAAARSAPNTYVVDYAGLVSRYGALSWADERMRLYAGAPIAQAMTGHLAGEYVKFLRALAGGSKKCLVLDLDNTLWGGVVGEDGLGGIGLGPMYPGSAFVEFQRYVRRLHDRGVILAIASKNNPADVDEVFDRHEFMALERTHFARAEINWEPKSRSIATIARALNIGLEHVVFADDNPVEVEHVRETLPMVTVVQLPREPAEYVAALARHGWFDTLALSEEDRRRGELYRQRDAAESLRAESGSVEQFYRDLQMEIAIAPINDQSIARAAQLTQKTNQFNATTRRYTDAEVRQMAADARCTVRTVAVRDRFGDNGIVGLILARQDGATLDIDTLLLSCRVIGRTVETAMLAYACDDARRRGAARVSGRIIPTAKNAPVRDLFERHGFGKVGEEGDGVVRWELDLDESGVAWPDWFRVAALDLAPAVS